jgi:phosphate-selective porin OprO/OprP
MKPMVLLSVTTALLAAAPARAQSAPSAADLAALRAELDALRGKVDQLERQLAESRAAPASAPLSQTAAATPQPAPKPASAPSTAIAWKGAPQFEDKASGFTFKPKGFVQFDSGRVYNPSDALNATGNFGNRTRLRRAVFGAEGTLPGGFGYKAEFNFADGVVGYEDVVVTWQPKGTPLQLTIGNAYPLSGLDVITSSRLTSFAEREQASEAFNFNRRVGASLGLIDPKDRYTLTAGLYQTGITSDFGDDGWQASIRGTFSPTLGEHARLHIGANFQHRSNRTDVPQGRYRTRPLTTVTDFRFVDSGFITAGGDDVLGVELAGIFGPLHIAGEGHKLWVNDYRASLDKGGLFYASGPSYVSGYGEIGYYLTGETRGYKTGRWDRTKVLRPVGGGGWGALQLNARVDMVDLTDTVGGTVLLNGGRQTGYSLGTIWNPVDYVRFLLQYSHVDVEGGPSANLVVPASALPAVERKYSSDVMVLRAQLEF